MVRLPQVALPLGRFLGEDVALVGVAALVLAGSGLPEALGRRPIGLDLGHWESLRNLVTGLGGGDILIGASTLSVLPVRSEEHTSELQSLMRNSYAVFCLKKKKP